jgi:hypothetical protein
LNNVQYPTSSKAETEINLIINPGTKRTASRYKNPQYSSQNITLPNPRTSHAIPPSFTTCQLGPISVIIRNTHHIPIMWQEAPLSTIHLISPPNPPLPTLETRVTKENSLSYFEEKSSMVVVEAISDPSSSLFFFFLSRK